MKISQANDMQEKKSKCFPRLREVMHDGVAVYSAIDDGQDFIFCEHNPAGERITGLQHAVIRYSAIHSTY